MLMSAIYVTFNTMYTILKVLQQITENTSILKLQYVSFLHLKARKQLVEYLFFAMFKQKRLKQIYVYCFLSANERK